MINLKTEFGVKSALRCSEILLRSLYFDKADVFEIFALNPFQLHFK